MTTYIGDVQNFVDNGGFKFNSKFFRKTFQKALKVFLHILDEK